MSIYEVGFICKHEGGHGYMLGCPDEDISLDFVKKVLLHDIRESSKFWVEAALEDSYYDTQVESFETAKKQVEVAKTVEEIKAIEIDEHMLGVRVKKVKLLSYEDFD